MKDYINMTVPLKAALDALLAAPRSVDAFGYVHFLDGQLLDAVRTAYDAATRA